MVFKLDGEEWTLDLREGKGALYKGAPEEAPNLTLTISDENFAKMVMGKLGPQQVGSGGLFLSAAIIKRADMCGGVRAGGERMTAGGSAGGRAVGLCGPNRGAGACRRCARLAKWSRARRLTQPWSLPAMPAGLPAAQAQDSR